MEARWCVEQLLFYYITRGLPFAMRGRRRLLSKVKSVFIRPDKEPCRIQFGVFRGIMMDLDLSCQSQIFLGLYEREVYPYLEHLSQGVRTAIDIGANEGLYTLYFLLKVPVWKVFAFEPSNLSRLRIMDNLRLNGLENDRRLTLSPKFIGSTNTEEMCTLDWKFLA